MAKITNTTNTITNTMSTTGVNQTLSTTGINESYQVGDITLNYPQNGVSNIHLSGTSYDLMEVIDRQEARIEELEKLVNLLVAEVLPERLI